MTPSESRPRCISVTPPCFSVLSASEVQSYARRRHGTATMEALVGAGGWGYFAGGLEAYARGFRFVELNASFYRPVPERYARRWRSSVPDDFVFSVKANRVITHSNRVRASEGARKAFAHDLRIARI